MALQNLSTLFPFLFLSLRVIAFYSIMGLLQPTLFTAAANFSNETDRLALLKFKESIPIDPNGVLSSWNDSVPFCDWPGIACNVRHQRVTALELEGYNLRGTISPYIGNLSFMSFQDAWLRIPNDNEMVAHVNDFGLARLISNDNDFSKSQTSTNGIKGTIGYAAPEYAMGGEPSKQGDVYSYGILLLEMFTGKRPTDEMFKDDFNLHNFVKMALPEGVVQIMDSSLLPAEVEETITEIREDGRNYRNNGGIEIDIEARLGHINFENANQISARHLQSCLVSILEIGLAYSKELPNERVNMRDVIRKLQRIRDAYLGVVIHEQTRRTG